MCFLCMAIPMTVSLGARAHVKHRERCQEAATRGEPTPKFVNVVVLQKASSVAVVGLVAGAVVYHTVVAPALGSG